MKKLFHKLFLYAGQSHNTWATLTLIVTQHALRPTHLLPLILHYNHRDGHSRNIRWNLQNHDYPPQWCLAEKLIWQAILLLVILNCLSYSFIADDTFRKYIVMEITAVRAQCPILAEKFSLLADPHSYCRQLSATIPPIAQPWFSIYMYMYMQLSQEWESI